MANVIERAASPYPRAVLCGAARRLILGRRGEAEAFPIDWVVEDQELPHLPRTNLVFQPGRSKGPGGSELRDADQCRRLRVIALSRQDKPDFLAWGRGPAAGLRASTMGSARFYIARPERGSRGDPENRFEKHCVPGYPVHGSFWLKL